MATVQTGIATSFIDFSRASNATVTDSDGKVKWAPHNLLTNSESFDAAAWTKASAVVAVPVVTANNVAAPNGTQTADRIVFPAVSGTNANSLVVQSPTQVLSTPHTAAVYLRGDAGGEVVWISWTSDGVTYSRTQCTLTTSWQLFTLAYTTAASGVQYIQIGVDLRDASQSAKGAQTIYAWGAHLYRSDLGGMQPNTSAYPMYNPTTPKNLLGYTEDLGNAYWQKAGIAAFGSGSVANAAVAPNGLQTADLITTDTSNGYHVLYASPVTLAGGVGMHSFYVKPNGYTKVAIRENSTANYYASFNLVGAGSVLDSTATYATPAIVALADGWYRISCRMTNATSQAASIWILPDSYTTGSPVAFWTANGTSGIYLWGAQLSDSASLDPYVPNYGAAVTSVAYYGPRRDFDPVTLACKGLLVEEQRSNNIVGSANFSGGGSGWVLDGASLTASATAGPDGSLSATSIVQGTGNNRTYQFDNSSVTGSKVFSIYVKPNAGSSLSISAIGGMSPNGPAVINATTGAVTGFTGASSVAVGNGWYRVFLPVTVTVASGSGTYWLISGPASSVFIWGAQLEAGSFATSYIPTGAATATRNADVASVSTQAFPYSATEGSIVVNASSPCIAAIANMITLDNGTTQERIRLLTDVASVKTIVTQSNTTQANLSPGSATANTPFKFAVAYKVNDFAAVVNGSAAATYPTGNVPVVNIARLGADSSGNYLNGHIRQITYLPRRISNADLVTRST